jgi:hypothetical protein
MAPAIGDILRVVCKMSDGEDAIQNVYHVVITGSTPPSDNDLEVGLTDWADSTYDNIDGIMPDNISFDTIQIYNLTQDLLFGEFPWPTLTVGGSAQDQMPPQCSPLLLFNTVTIRSQGRKFLPPFASDRLDTDGTIAAAALTNMASFGFSCIFGVQSVNWDLVFGNYHPVGASFSPWTSYVVRDLWATQRRRYTGKGI